MDKDATVIVKSDRKSVKTVVKADDSGTYVIVASPKKRLTAHDKEGKLLLDYPAESVARLTLNRPSARNALDHETLGAIAEALPNLDRGIEVR